MDFKRAQGALTAAALLLAGPAFAGSVLTVCNGTAGCPGGWSADGVTRFDSAEAAAANAEDGDTILIWPGTYKEQVFLTKNDITVRGMDRYAVVFDGDVDGNGNFGGSHPIALQSGNRAGTVAPRNVTFENMSATGYSNQPFFWVNTNGYFGRYLTAYNNQTYGVYAFASTGDPSNPSTISHSYAANHNDGGFYIGECMPCNAVIDSSWSEHNALGYSGTNAGGNLFLQSSVWAHNLAGILPNTLESENDAPQRGAVIRNNLVYDNNNAEAPIGGATAIAPRGTGILVAGGWANQIYGNKVYGNARAGIGLVWFLVPPQHNAVFGNVLWNNGFDYDGGADLIDAGPGSFYNCFEANVNRADGIGPDQEPSSDPPSIQTLNSCKSQIDPVAAQVAQSPAAAGMFAQAAGEGQLRYEMGERGTRDQPPAATPLDGDRIGTPIHAAAVACMPNPCAGLPDGDFCSGESPIGELPVSAECAAG